MKRLSRLTGLVVLLLVASANAAILRVDKTATGAGNGSSWADAFTEVRDAIGVAQPGDEIWVAKAATRTACHPFRRVARIAIKPFRDAGLTTDSRAISTLDCIAGWATGDALRRGYIAHR